MKTISFRIGCLMLLATGLVACSDDDNPGAGASAGGRLTAAVARQGNDFRMAFNQGRNDTPINVDLVTLTLDRTAEPIEF